ncbi:MAG: hypothetical protein ACRYGG_22375 [Janthinobacterium lividum]
MPGTNDIRAGGAFVELYVKGSADQQLTALQKRLSTFGSSISGFGLKMAGLGIGIVTPLLLAAKTFADVSDELSIASQRTGLSVEALSDLKYAAQQAGVGFDELQAAIGKMYKTLYSGKGMADAVPKASKTDDKFKVGPSNPSRVAAGDDTSEEAVKAGTAVQGLGLDVKALQAMSPDQSFDAIATALSKIQAPGQRAAAAMAIFGRAGAGLLPLLNGGAAGIAAMTQRARDLGLEFSSVDVEAGRRFADTIKDLVAQVQSLAFNVGSTVAGALQPFASGLSRVLTSVIAFVKANRSLVLEALAVGGALVVAGGALVALGTTLRIVGGSLGGIVSAFKLVGSTVGLLGTLVTAPFTILASVLGSVVSLVGGGVVAAFGVLGTVISAVFTGGVAAVGLLLTPLGLIAAVVLAAGAAFLVFSGLAVSAFTAVRDAVGSAMSAVETAVGSAARRIGSAFMTAFQQISQDVQAVRATINETFASLGDALGAGDLVLAGQVLWTGLKLAFVEGTATMRTYWSQFKAYFIQVAGAAFYGALEVFQRVKAGLLDAWATTSMAMGDIWDAFTSLFADAWYDAQNVATHVIDALADAWDTYVGGISDTFNSAMGGVRKAWNEIKGLFDETIDVNVENSAIDDEVKKKRLERKADQAARDEGRDADRKAADQKLSDQKKARDQGDINAAGKRAGDAKASIDKTQSDKQSAIDDLEKREQALSQSADDGSKAEIAKLEQQRTDLQKQLDALRDKARTERDDKAKADDKAKKPAVDTSQFDNVPGVGAKSGGIFNVAAVQTLQGDDSWAAATAKNTAAAIPLLLKLTKMTGLQFT